MNNPKSVARRSHNRDPRNNPRARRRLAHVVAEAWSNPLPRGTFQAIWPVVLDVFGSCLPPTACPSGQDGGFPALIDVVKWRKQLSPQQFGDSGAYLASTAVASLFGKTETTIPGLDPEEQAIIRFRAAERLCKITNRRLRHYRQFDHYGRPAHAELPVHQVFHLARRKIQSWLGCLDVPSVLVAARHGPGGVVGLPRPATTPYYKFAKDGYTCSTGAYWFALRAITSSEVWLEALSIESGLIQHGPYPWDCVPYDTKVRIADRAITIAECNQVTFVPKDPLTKRSISVEPHLNVMLQLGVGELLKRKLKAVGCDLTDQTRNQHLAFVGSVQHAPEDPVTLDLSMASDTLSTELVRELLPSDWFEFLDCIRSRYGSFRGESWEWEKFSSMGNGFTFELESMIFYALAQACSDVLGVTDWYADTFGRGMKYAYVSVFGDDIIVPGNVADLLTRILRYCGFRLNSEKSFTSGPFRESCGCDFWNGVDVRPFYYKRGISVVKDLIHLHNGIKWVGRKGGWDVSDVLHLIRFYLPPIIERHLRNPLETMGDEHLWVESHEADISDLSYYDPDLQRWAFPTMRSQPESFRGSTHWRYVQYLYCNTHREVRERHDVIADIITNPLGLHFLSGGSRADVVKSGASYGKIGWS